MLDVGQSAPLKFANGHAMVTSCLTEMKFPERVSPSKAARRHRILNNPGAYSGPWGDGPYFVGHLDRPMDCCWSESAHREVAVMGPSQVGKSEIGNNWQLHGVIYDPADMLFVMPDRISIDSYVKTQFDKMIELTPELQDRMLAGASSDTINLKRFRGTDLHFLWPAGPTFRYRAISRGRLDDLDDIPTDISDQGDAVSLMRGRMGSFSAYGQTMIYVNSTPALGARAGIEALVAAGTDERFWVDCLMCGTPFPLYFDRLSYEKEGTDRDAAASAAVLCPEPGCGGVHVAREKRPLLETFRWIGKGEHAVSRKEDSSGKAGELEPNIRASFRFDGLFGFRPWSEIAQLGRSAEITLEYEQDEGALKTFDQTIVGRNFKARGKGAAPVDEDALVRRAKASPYAMREVPPGVQVLIAAIDQQGNRFEVAVWGFGQNFQAWLIDRFALLTTEENGHERPLRPFTKPEDWSVLYDKVMSLTYPLAGTHAKHMKIFNTIVDTGGLDNATDNAFAWWHAMVAGDMGSGRAPLPATAITLVKGGNKPNAKLLPRPTVDVKRQIKGAPQAELYMPNVNRLKDIADVRLNRRDAGPGYIHLPHDVPGVNSGDIPNYIAELRTELKVGDQWTREPHSANETWDLYIYAYTVVLRFGGNDASLGWVPEWARPPSGGPVKLESPASAKPSEVDEVPPSQPVKKLEKRTTSAARPRKRRRTIRSRRAG